MGKEPHKRQRRRPKQRRIALGEINVVSQPHSVERYKRLFKVLADNRIAVLYHGHRQMEVGTYSDLNDPRLPDAVTGRLFLFAKIDFDDAWINLQKNEEASPRELAQVQIPEHLAPEFRQFRYVFDAKRHRMFFETYGLKRQRLSPRATARALDQMFNKYQITKEFGEVKAFMVADEEAVEDILNTRKLKKLTIHLSRPNADDKEFEEEILKKLNEQNVGTEETVLRKAPGTPAIIPNALTRQLARIAAKLGFVEAKGKDERNAPVTKNTQDHPKEHNVVFPETVDSFDAIIQYIAQNEGKGDA